MTGGEAPDLPSPAPSVPSALPLWDDEHVRLREAARAFVADEIAPHVETWERDGDYPASLFRRVGDAGWLGRKFAPRWGGSGPDLRAQAVWVEELARAGSGGIAADLGAHSDLAALYLDRYGDDGQKDRWLAPSIAGELIGALAVTEPGAGSDVAGLATRARRVGDGWALDGTKAYITNGSWCDYVVTAARVAPEDGGGERAHDQITLFVVERGDDGFSSRRMPMLGWRTSHTGELALHDVRVGDDRRLGDVGGGFRAIMRNFAWERLTLSLGAVAGAEATLEDAVAHARDRRASGRPVPSFPAWRHRLASLATRIAAARRLTEHALRLTVAAEERTGVDVDAGEVVRVVAMSKLVTQRLAFEVADASVQLHGGDGYRMGHPAQRWWRDARLGPIGGGADEIMREIIARIYGL